MKADMPFLYQPKKIDIPFILTQVSKTMNIPYDVITVKSRKREIVTARQMSMCLAKEFTTYSLAKIGFELGGKDHATVLHAVKSINNLIDTKDDIIMENYLPLREKFISLKKKMREVNVFYELTQEENVFNTEK